MRWFFNGLPPGEPIPWHVWWIPLIWWFSFAAAIIGICMGLSIVLRKQWVEYERLSYPLVEAGACLVAGADDPRGRRPMWRSRLFWVGAVFAFFILAYNTLSWFDMRWPVIDLSGTSLEFMRGAPGLRTRVNFLTLGLSYFAPQQVPGQPRRRVPAGDSRGGHLRPRWLQLRGGGGIAGPTTAPPSAGRASAPCWFSFCGGFGRLADTWRQCGARRGRAATTGRRCSATGRR